MNSDKNFSSMVSLIFPHDITIDKLNFFELYNSVKIANEEAP